MVRVYERLKREKRESRLLLTVHDELLIETKRGEEEAVERILREEMMGAADLAVPLEVDIHVGDDWYEAK
jgi:DNA polymerase-1